LNRLIPQIKIDPFQWEWWTFVHYLVDARGAQARMSIESMGE
jgi:hypothetical protein